MKTNYLKWALVTAALLAVPEVALANGFDGIGDKLTAVVCDFTKSKIVTFIGGAAVLMLLVAIALNEDNRAFGTFLKIALGVVGILFLPNLLTMLGLMGMNC